MRTFQEAANFVRSIDLTASIEQIFPECNAFGLKLIRNSLETYAIKVKPEFVYDPFERTLLATKSKMYRFYMALKNPIQGISLPWYDMVENGNIISLSELLIQWSRRKVGLLNVHKDKNDDSHTFTILTKRNANEPFSDSSEVPEYPDCKLSTNLTNPFLSWTIDRNATIAISFCSCCTTIGSVVFDRRNLRPGCHRNQMENSWMDYVIQWIRNKYDQKSQKRFSAHLCGTLCSGQGMFNALVNFSFE